jgi:hypothetical protein
MCMATTPHTQQPVLIKPEEQTLPSSVDPCTICDGCMLHSSLYVDTLHPQLRPALSVSSGPHVTPPSFASRPCLFTFPRVQTSKTLLAGWLR